MTVDVDYADWAASRRELCRDLEVSPAACRRNLQALAEEAFVNELDDYVPYVFVD
jgi:DNA-binding transcriptional regulator YhcF (GntR family)